MDLGTLQIDKMTVTEKLIAMEALWDGLCRDETQIPMPNWHKEVLDERERQIGSGEARYIHWETAKFLIRDEVGR